MTGYVVFRPASYVIHMGLTSYDQERSDVEKAKVEKRLMKRQQKNKRRLEELGIEYDIDAVAYVGSVSLSPCCRHSSCVATEKAKSIARAAVWQSFRAIIRTLR
jgi:hypothetical protein